MILCCSPSNCKAAHHRPLSRSPSHQTQNRHELHCIYSKVLKIRNLILQSGKCARCADSRGLILCIAPHMYLINHKVLKRLLKLLYVAPVKAAFTTLALYSKSLPPSGFSPHFRCPVTALEYGSKRTFSSLNRSPFAGS